jgi:hypothetical protein
VMVTSRPVGFVVVELVLLLFIIERKMEKQG